MKNISLNQALKELGWRKARPINPLAQYAYRIFDQEGREVGTFTAHELTNYFNRHGMFQKESEVAK